MNTRKIDTEFKASQVGRLAERHERTAESRKEQSNIPYTGPTYAEEQLQHRHQSSTKSTQ